MLARDKRIWITGASSGIGKALALELSKQGADLIISSRKKTDLEIVKNSCYHPEKVQVVPLDLSDHEDIPKIANPVLDEGAIDLLINNGGISQRSLAMDTELPIEKRLMDVNFFGTIALTKAVLPGMIKRKQGQIVVISSVSGKLGTPLRSSYAASKHALHGYFDSLRAELHREKIAITLICPGYIQTNVSLNALTADGSPHDILDEKTAKGLTPERFAKKALKVIQKRKKESYIGGLEILGIYIKRFFPALAAKIVTKVNVI